MDQPLDVTDLTWLRPDWQAALAESVAQLERRLEHVRAGASRRPQAPAAQGAAAAAPAADPFAPFLAPCLISEALSAASAPLQ